MSLADVDGGLIGGSSLNAADFIAARPKLATSHRLHCWLKNHRRPNISCPLEEHF